MEIILGLSVSALAVLATGLSIVTHRQQKELEMLWKEMSDINREVGKHDAEIHTLSEGFQNTFTAQCEVNEALLDLMTGKKKNG